MRFTDKSMEQHQLLIQWSEGQFTPLALSAATTSREKSRRSRGKESKMTSQNTIEENKRIVRAFIETAFNQHQADRAADYLTPDMQWHGGTLGTVESREKVAGLVNAISSSYARSSRRRTRATSSGFPRRADTSGGMRSTCTAWRTEGSPRSGRQTTCLLSSTGLGPTLLPGSPNCT